MNKIKFFNCLFIIVFHIPFFTFANGADQLQGKWIAKKYLQQGIENGKVVTIQNLTLKPAHFGLFMYSPKQTLEIKFPDTKENPTGKIPGQIRSDRTLLDSSCLKSADYKDYSGCGTETNQELNLAFRIFEIGDNLSSSEKAMISAWKKSGLSDITTGFAATAADLSSHIGFVGPNHLLLRVNYFKNALRNSEDAFASKCPKRNKCYVTFLQFDRVPAEKSNEEAPAPSDNIH